MENWLLYSANLFLLKTPGDMRVVQQRHSQKYLWVHTLKIEETSGINPYYNPKQQKAFEHFRQRFRSTATIS